MISHLCQNKSPARRMIPWLLPVLLVSCGKGEKKQNPSESAVKKEPTDAVKFDMTGSVSTGRVVAIGDVHGDLGAAQGALRLAGAIDEENRWSGGRLTVVQTGDALDRGDDDRAVMDLFEELRKQAGRAGGAFVALIGNHEIMNVYGDLRYITPKSAAAFDDLTGLALDNPRLALVPGRLKRRAAAFLPGGPYARALADNRITVKIGGTIFVHGGVLPWHVDYGLDRINKVSRDWMLKRLDRIPHILAAPQGPTWTREYSLDTDAQDCAMLDEVLNATGARRMVVGHQIQKQGISSACNGKVWRIDVGMSSFYRGPVEILEIHDGDRVSVKRAPQRAEPL